MNLPNLSQIWGKTSFEAEGEIDLSADIITTLYDNAEGFLAR
jgi:hypothetical protein